MKLAALFLSHLAVATLAVAAYIELSARRGVAAGLVPTPWPCVQEPGAWHLSGPCPVEPLDDWATDPRTAELATGGGQEGAK